jgi:hypothetical protein
VYYVVGTTSFDEYIPGAQPRVDLVFQLTCVPKIPELISRTIKLIHIYYGYQVFKKPSADLHLCDIQDPVKLASQLCLLGYAFHANSYVFTMLAMYVPEFMLLILKEIEFDTRCRQIVTAYLELHAKQDRPDASERAQRQIELTNVQNYRAHHFTCYLLFPIWMWIADTSTQVLTDSIRSQAFDLLVKTTSSLPNVLLTGYSPFLILSQSRMVERYEE